MRILTPLFLATFFEAFWLTEAATFQAVYKKVKVMYNGKTTRLNDKYCEYKYRMNPLDKEDVVFRVRPGSKFTHVRDNQCVECKCGGPKPGGLRCRTLVPTLKYAVDSKCVPVTVRCMTRWVLRDDPKKRCPKDMIPAVTAVGK